MLHCRAGRILAVFVFSEYSYWQLPVLFCLSSKPLLLTKPWDDDALKMIIHAALDKYDRQQKVLRVFKMFDENPALLPFIEHNFHSICRVLIDKQYALSDPVLNDDELRNVMQL